MPILDRRAFALGASASLMASDWRDVTPRRDFAGWSRIPLRGLEQVRLKSQWKSNGKLVELVGDAGHELLRFEEQLADFDLHVDWRVWPVPSGQQVRYNGGILFRTNPDATLFAQAQTGDTGGYLFVDKLVNGVKKRDNLREQMRENHLKPPGQWNRYAIRCVGPTIELRVNGKLVNRYGECQILKGFWGLEAEGYAMQFRHIRIRSLA